METDNLQQLATCACGDEFTEHDPGTCVNCLAGLDKTAEVEFLRGDRDRLLGQRQDQAVEIDALKAALEGVLPFLTGEYWPGVVADAAVDRAIAVVRKVGAGDTALKGSNVKVTGAPANGAKQEN